MEAILKIRIPGGGHEDVLAWAHERTGIFSVRSAYRLAVRRQEAELGMQASSTSAMGTRPSWNVIWKLKVLNKVRVFAWKVTSGVLPTKLNKWRRTLETTSQCVMCGLAPETEHHALIQYPHARNLRWAMKEYWRLPDDQQIPHDNPEWLLLMLNRLSLEDAGRLVLFSKKL